MSAMSLVRPMDLHSSPPSLLSSPSLRYPPRLGRRTNAPPPWTGVRLPSHGQPGPVCPPPVLPAADHAGLPLWSRLAQNKLTEAGLRSRNITLSIWRRPTFKVKRKKRKRHPALWWLRHYTFRLIVRFTLYNRASFMLAEAQHCALTRNPVQPGDRVFTKALWARRSTGHTIETSVILGWLRSTRGEWGREGGRVRRRGAKQAWGMKYWTSAKGPRCLCKAFSEMVL